MSANQTGIYRTKVLKLSPEQDALFREPVERLRIRQITVEKYQQEIMELLCTLDLHKEFAGAISAVRGNSAAEWLVRRHIGACRYTVQVYGVEAGEVHPPHHHHNLISTQMVLEGCVHLRAYERVGRNVNGQLLLRLVRDDRLGPGDVFQVSEWQCNAHWFGAVDQAALIFSVDARGFEQKTFDTPDCTGFGRRYLDPTRCESEGVIVCESLDREEAMRRFRHRPLSSFSGMF
ncbi:MAG: hypothetical protein AAFW82_04930 [Pseudomonadota bacterium]